MQASRLAGAAAVPMSVAQRIIHVTQNLFPGPGKPTSNQVELGLGWASSPKLVTVDGKTYPVVFRQGSTNGAPFSVYEVSLPILKDGVHSASVRLASGMSVVVLVSVKSIH